MVAPGALDMKPECFVILPSFARKNRYVAA